MMELQHNGFTPVPTDGRDIDTEVGMLLGEGAQQEAGPVESHVAAMSRTWTHIPAPVAGDPTYFDRPMLPQPVWEWAVPTYYFAGGAAGASLVIGAAAQLDRTGRLAPLIRRCHMAGIIGSAVSGGLLIYDLGRPMRFLNMLRVFRPTSPMNMGVWILSSIAPSAIVASLLATQRGFLGAIGQISGIASGIAGLGLSTYTGVLVSTSAIPVWQQSRHVLPILFGASAMATAGSIYDLFFEDPEARRVTYTFGMLGRAAELTAGIVMERQIEAQTPLVAEPLKRGVSGALWRTAAVLTAASLIAGMFPRSRKARIASGVLGILGSFTLRHAIHRAGFASARDPRASFRQQRSGHGAAELTA
jgi:hypothetical protein